MNFDLIKMAMKFNANIEIKNLRLGKQIKIIVQNIRTLKKIVYTKNET